MKKILTVIVALLAMVAILSGRAEAGVNNFKDITSYTSGDEFRVVMAFAGAPQTVVKYYDKSIQIDVPGAQVHPAKRVFDVNQGGISSINVYQVNPNLLRIRVFPINGMKALKEAFSSSKNGEKLVLSVGHKALALPIAAEKLTPQADTASKTSALETPKAAMETSLMVEATTKAAEAETKPEIPAGEAKVGDDMLADIQKSLDELKKDTGGKQEMKGAAGPKVHQAGMVPTGDPSQVPGMGEAFVKIGSALLVVLALILAISYGAKKYLGAAEGGLGMKKQLKILSNHFIGVKKNVTIIEVGGEILVLGVTNSNVNLLARYTDPEKIENIRLAHRLPDKPIGIFKKLPSFGWMKKRQPAPKPINQAFARQVASYADNMNDAVKEKAKKDEIVTRKDEMVSNVTRSIADRLRVMEEAAG